MGVRTNALAIGVIGLIISIVSMIVHRRSAVKSTEEMKHKYRNSGVSMMVGLLIIALSSSFLLINEEIRSRMTGIPDWLLWASFAFFCTASLSYFSKEIRFQLNDEIVSEDDKIHKYLKLISITSISCAGASQIGIIGYSYYKDWMMKKAAEAPKAPIDLTPPPVPTINAVNTNAQ